MDYMVKVHQISIHKNLMYKGQIIVSYSIRYPEFISDDFRAITHINRYYETMAKDFERYCEKKLYCMAIDSYEYNVKKKYPIHKYEGDLVYAITYNNDCTLSLFFDRYEYTGGAHGNTERFADTWNLNTGKKHKLEDFFVQTENLHRYLIDSINQYISGQMAENNEIYFDDYYENTEKYFDPNNFYITHAGVVIFYDQYSIAPYSSGIREFLMKYSDDRVLKPIC